MNDFKGEGLACDITRMRVIARKMLDYLEQVAAKVTAAPDDDKQEQQKGNDRIFGKVPLLSALEMIADVMLKLHKAEQSHEVSAPVAGNDAYMVSPADMALIETFLHKMRSLP